MEQASPMRGEHVTLVPYVRGESPQVMLGQIWSCMRRTPGATKRVFWGQTVDQEAYRGDLESFVAVAPKRMFLAAFSRASSDMVGALWWEDIVPHHRATIGLFFERSAWGKASREGTMLATEWAQKHLGIHTAWGFTPWPLAKRHGEAIGWICEATLPGYAIVEGEPRALYVMRKEL